MARVKKKKVVSLPGKFFRSLSLEDRDREVAYLKESILLARKFGKGFEARDGYSLKRSEIVRMPAARLEKLRRVSKVIRQAMGSPYLAYSPSSKQSRAAIARHAGQLFKGQKRFFVHTDFPEKSRVRVIDGRVEISRKINEKITIFDRYFYLHKPRTWDDIISQIEDMLPEMPDGFYNIISSKYGQIGMHMHKKYILGELQRRWADYDRSAPGFAGAILGLKWVGDSEQARREYNERPTARQLWRERENERLRLEREGKACRKCGTLNDSRNRRCIKCGTSFSDRATRRGKLTGRR